MKRKTVFWIVLFAALAVLSAGIYLLHGGGTRAVISVDGQVLRTVDLDAVTGGFNLQIAWSTGYAAGNADR